MFGEDVHFDGEGQDVCRHDEDENQDLHDLDHPFTNWAKDESGGIGQAVYTHVSQLELGDCVACICGYDTETADDEDTWQEAEDGHDFGKRQDTQRDGLGNQQHTCFPPGERFIAGFTFLAGFKGVILCSSQME